MNRSEIVDYWKSVCPDAPAEYLVLATDLSNLIFESLPNTAFGNRVAGKTETYTPLVFNDRTVVAAIDPRASFLKLDLRLPTDIANQGYAASEFGRGKPRRGGRWMLTRVGTKITPDRARDLVIISLKSEFAESTNLFD